MLTVTFDELEDALAGSRARVGAAEAHGALCGALAAVPDFRSADWIDDVVPGGGEGTEALRSRNLLETLAAETQGALAGLDMEFEPLLPGEEAPLAARVAALAAWCGGFLYGLGTGAAAGELPETVQEVMRDFAEISRATVDSDETEESSENSYAQLVEYLRAATQLAYEELTERRAEAGR